MKKEIFIENVSKLKGNMKQYEIAQIMGCSTSTASRYLSPDKEDFPSGEALINLSQYFGVSIDWLVGNTTSEKAKEELSARDICEIILQLSKNSMLHFGTVTVEEYCYDYCGSDENGNAEISVGNRSNKYISLYFSDRWKVKTEDDAIEASSIGNVSYKEYCVNKFLSRLLGIKRMLAKGDLDQDMYDRLLESYLNEVPDK